MLTRSIRSVVFTTVLIAAISGSAMGKSIEPGAVLAEWNDGAITVEDYVAWWRQMPASERDTLDTTEDKEAFLQNMINADLMLAEAETLGIDRHSDMLELLARRTFSAVSTAILDRAMATSPPADEDEVERIYSEQLTQVNVRRIMVESRDKGGALMDSIAAGVPFEDLAYRHSTDVTGERGGFLGTLRRAELEEPWQTQVFRLEAGEVSQPFYTEKGWAIVKVETRAMVEPQDPEAMREGIRRSLEKRSMFAEQAAYLDSLRTAYQAEIYGDAVIGLCAEYALTLAMQGERTAVISGDIVPPFTEEQKRTRVAAFTGWQFTYEDCANSILTQPYPARPVLDDPEQMVAYIGRQLKDSLIVREAEKLGVYDWPEVKDEIARSRRRRLATRVYRTLTREAEVPADTIRAYYDRYREHYRMSAGHNVSKIVAPSQVVADSIMARLEAGESFEEIAKMRSIDPFSAPRGGKLGFMSIGQDEEFDIYLETMEVGETRYFRSLEGHLILRLNDRHEERAATFEEAESRIEQDLIDIYKNLMLEEWLAAERESRGVRTYSERLESISLIP